MVPAVVTLSPWLDLTLGAALLLFLPSICFALSDAQ